MDTNTVFDDIMQGLHEIVEYQKGNLELKSRVVTAPDNDISMMYSKLNDNDKFIVRSMVTRLFQIENEGVIS
jgi:hypothetical protein